LLKINQESSPKYWKKIQENLFSSEGKDTYISWYSKLKPIIYENGVLSLKAPSRFIADYMGAGQASPK
jgi:hypothetical protein